MDRIDIHMQVPRVEYQKLRDMRPGESSADVRARVKTIRSASVSVLREPIFPAMLMCTPHRFASTAF